MTQNIYLDLSILDSVTGGCKKSSAHVHEKPIVAHPASGGGFAPTSAPTSLIGSSAPSSSDDPMQALAMLGLGVLDLVENGQIDPNLIISGIEDALGGGHGGLLSGMGGLGDSGAPPTGTSTDAGGLHHLVGEDMLGHDSQLHGVPQDHVRDHRGDDQSHMPGSSVAPSTPEQLGVWMPGSAK